MEKYTERVKEVLAQQITELEDVEGYLVKACSDECVVLVFGDGQWACFITQYEYEDHVVGLSKSPPDIYHLWRAKLLTNWEHAEQIDHGKKYRAKQQESSDKKQLQRLQAKYGKG